MLDFDKLIYNNESKCIEAPQMKVARLHNYPLFSNEDRGMDSLSEIQQALVPLQC